MNYEDLENFNFLLSFIVLLYEAISIFRGYRVSTGTNFNNINALHTEDDFERGKNLVINHPAMFKTLFLGLLFAVKSKSGIKKLGNLLLLEMIGPKNATLFIQDHIVEHYLHALNFKLVLHTVHSVFSQRRMWTSNECNVSKYIVCC